MGRKESLEKMAHCVFRHSVGRLCTGCGETRQEGEDDTGHPDWPAVRRRYGVTSPPWDNGGWVSQYQLTRDKWKGGY